MAFVGVCGLDVKADFAEVVCTLELPEQDISRAILWRPEMQVVQEVSETTEEVPTFLWFTASLPKTVWLVLVLIPGGGVRAWSQNHLFGLVIFGGC